MPALKERTSADRDAGLERLEMFVSPYAGVVRWIDEILLEPVDARMSFVMCEMTPRTLTLDSAYPMAAGAAAYTVDDARAAAIGEAVERYCGTYLPKSKFVLASATELGPKAVRPERFSLHCEEQYAADGFRFEPFTSDSRVNWVKGWSIPGGEEAYLPQQLVYMDSLWNPPPPGEVSIGTGSSSGMALGISRDDAVLGGLLEVIERDAFMLTWSNRISLPRLDWSSDPELVASHERVFGPTGLPYVVIDLSVWSGVPTVLAIHSAGVAQVEYSMGAASRPTIGLAWDKAVRECFQGLTMLKWSKREEPFRDDFSDLITPEDHSQFYLQPGHKQYADFLEASEEVRDVRDVPPLEGNDSHAWITAIAHRLEAIGASAYAVDVTTPDVQEAGLHVVKVICPELQPIDFVHTERYLGGSRLYEAAHKLGLREAPLSPDELNPYPHPFP